MKSPQSIKHLFERNDVSLVEAFFSNEIKNKKKQNRFIVKEKYFYSNVNYDECFEIILKRKNENLAIIFFKI